jgi:hypothetical protein
MENVVLQSTPMAMPTTISMRLDTFVAWQLQCVRRGDVEEVEGLQFLAAATSMSIIKL